MLADRERRSFEADGYLAVPGLFHVEELAWLGGEVRAVTHGSATRPLPSSWSSDEAPAGTFIDLHTRAEAFRRLALHPRLRELAADLAGRPVRLLRTRLCPGTHAGRGDPIWRRDAELWRRTGFLNQPDAITAAVVLDGHYSEATALHVLPGSHRAGESPAAPVRVPAALGSVILLHCATRYAWRRAGDPARPAFLVTYGVVAATEIDDARPAIPCPPADTSLWPVPIWIAG